MHYTLESSYRVYDDSTGCYWLIQSDTAGLGGVEVRYYEGGKRASDQALTVPPAAARLIAKAMLKVAAEIEEV